MDGVLHVFGFNYTKLDIEGSRSFGLTTSDKKVVKEALSLFEADSTRQPYVPSDAAAGRESRDVCEHAWRRSSRRRRSSC